MRSARWLLLYALFPIAARAEEGTFPFKPLPNPDPVPVRYRLEERTFTYKMEPKRTLPVIGVQIDRVTFPSPIESAYPENNTVHAEYYRPIKPGNYPAVVVLDITGGDQTLSRTLATHFAQNDICALFVQMAYYGPRRPSEGKVRMLSTNIPRTMEAVRQTLLDCRVAGAWLANRPEVDSERIGILGTSLGSFVATLTAEMDPRFQRVAILLGGGGLVEAFYDHPQAKPYRKFWESVGGTQAGVAAMLAPVDPLTCAANLKNRDVVMIAAKRDEVVPPSAALRLWEATDRKAKIVWFDTTHYGAALFIIPALRPVVELLQRERSPSTAEVVP